MEILPQFRLNVEPVSSPEAVVRVPHVRFTVLSPRLIRMEYDPEDRFEDRPSQVFWYRRQPVPAFTARRGGRGIQISTEFLQLRYNAGEIFSHDSLYITLLDKNITWHFGDKAEGNLQGTFRTLDGADGPIPLEDGLLSTSGWTVVDDSNGLVFNSESWICDRQNERGALDLYFFGYGNDYSAALSDFYHVSGPPGLVPRWALGNWWSRYWDYHQVELSNLMVEFQSLGVPLSVCIVDMDWHLTQTGNRSTGWTGYTWNRTLFPDPQEFIHFIHSLGLKTGLNLHPAEGIHNHEDAYVEMARATGIDPTSGEPVRFVPEDPNFVKPYFEILHHPQEEGGLHGDDGVDFWWMDWQQGNPVKTPGLNLLWWINHLHYLDQGREKRRRHFLFSRWGGLGNHRYPIGFSGDSIITWRTLAFQPHFTATAANVGYGWWSHDIGGHFNGMEDSALYTRWVQFGVFSPIFRLHSTKNPFHERHPWGYDESTFYRVRRAMQLRHSLIPYIYSMAWRDRQNAAPLVRPMYHLHPTEDAAYMSPGQYYYGSELIVAPYTSPLDDQTRLSRKVIWLPEGRWFDFWRSTSYPGGWYALHGDMNDIPVFAKAGAIVPLDSNPTFGSVRLPESLDIHIFPGADGTFELFEDDGESQAYLEGDYAITRIQQSWIPGKMQTITIQPAQGSAHLLPSMRSYRLYLHAINSPSSIKVRQDGESIPAQVEYDAGNKLLLLSGISGSPSNKLEIIIEDPMLVEGDHHMENYLKILKSIRANPEILGSLTVRAKEIVDNPGLLAPYLVVLAPSQLRAILEVITEAGMDYQASSGQKLLILWNNQERSDLTYLISSEAFPIHDVGTRYPNQQGPIPKYRGIKLDQAFKIPWKKDPMPTLVQIDYGILLKVRQLFYADDGSARPIAGLC